MKTKKLLSLLLGCIAAVYSHAQCSAFIGLQNNPNSPTIFWVDSAVNVTANTVYSWDFGDGNSATGPQTSHTFLFNGMIVTYNVCLTLSDSSNGCTFTTCAPVTFPDTLTGNCIATITYTNQDSIYTFTATGSGSAPFTYVWSVNGQLVGNTSAVTLVIDTLNNSNYSEVCVDLTDANGCTTRSCEYISAANQPGGCSAYATYTNQDSLFTFFTATIGSSPVTYAWYVDSVLVDTNSTFSTVLNSGFHDVCLTVLDANGSYCYDCIYLTNTPGGGGNACQAYFVILADSSSGSTGYYYGYNYSNGLLNQNVLWDFGDGNTSTNPYPVHTYAQPGNYIVCLTIGTAGTSCYDTYCDSSFYAFKTEGGQMSQLTILSPTGINESAQSVALNFYPNPVTHYLTIDAQSDIKQVRIFNLNGQKMLENNMNPKRVNVDMLNAGIYILEIHTGNQITRSKLIKE